MDTRITSMANHQRQLPPPQTESAESTKRSPFSVQPRTPRDAAIPAKYRASLTAALNGALLSPSSPQRHSLPACQDHIPIPPTTCQARERRKSGKCDTDNRTPTVDQLGLAIRRDLGQANSGLQVCSQVCIQKPMAAMAAMAPRPEATSQEADPPTVTHKADSSRLFSNPCDPVHGPGAPHFWRMPRPLGEILLLQEFKPNCRCGSMLFRFTNTFATMSVHCLGKA